MKSVRLQPLPLPPLLRPMRLSVPDFPAESDSSPVSSDDESEYFGEDEDDNNTNEDEDEGYDSNLEYRKPIWEKERNFQQVDESKGVDFPHVPHSPPVNEEIDSSDCESGDSNSLFNYFKEKEEVYDVIVDSWEHFGSDLELDKPIWESYYRQVDESKGFDIKGYPGPRPLPNFFLVPCYLNQRKKRRMLKGFAESALKKYNDDKGTNHVIDEVLFVKRGACRDEVYYLIFSAKTGKRERDFFHAMALKDQEDNLHIPVVRPRVISSPSPQSTSVVPDDPAIIQTHFPNPTPSTIGMTSPGATQVADASTSAPSVLPVAPFLVNLPPNPLLPSSSLWGSSLPPPPVNINGPAVPNYWPGLVGSSGGVSHFQQQRFPPPPQSLVASLPIQQQAQHQNVNALARGSSSAAQHHPLLLPISTTSPNLLPALPSPSGQSNPGQPAKPTFNLSSIPRPTNASRALPTVAVNSCPRRVSSLEAELNVNAILAPVTKEPSSVISTSDSYPTFSQTVSSIADTKGASLSNLSRLSLLTPEVQSGVKDSSSSQSMRTPNFDVHTVQASVSEPLPSGSTEETLGALPKSPTKTLRGSTSSHHNRSHFARGRNGAHRDTLSTHDNSRGGHTHRGNAPNGGALYTHQSYRNASGRGNGLVGAALHSRQSNMGMGIGKVPNGVPQHNHRNVRSQFRGRGAKNPHVVKRLSKDFDFEAMNEKFNKEVWDFLGRSNKDESDDNGIGYEKEMDDSDAEDETGDGSAKHDSSLFIVRTTSLILFLVTHLIANLEK